MHLGNRPAPVHPGFYYFTIFLFQYCTILLCTILLLTIPLLLFYHDPSRLHLGNRPAAFQPGFYYFTILLFQYCTILLCTILLLIFPLFTILPRPQPFASRKPTCAGSSRILLFYYFRILLFQYCTILLCTILLLTIPLFTILPRPQPFASRKPTCAGSPGFCYFTTLLFYYYSTTTPAVCISETDLRRSPRILLFYYFTISVLYYSTMYYFTVNYSTSTIYYSTLKFASRKPSWHVDAQICMLTQGIPWAQRRCFPKLVGLASEGRAQGGLSSGLRSGTSDLGAGTWFGYPN